MGWEAIAGSPLGIGLVLFLGGVGAGRVLRHLDQSARVRAERLERELEETRGRFEAHREQVQKHFDQTSDLFRDLTQQYTALYAHLAEGARELCPERVPALGRGDAGGLLLGADSGVGTAPATAGADAERGPG